MDKHMTCGRHAPATSSRTAAPMCHQTTVVVTVFEAGLEALTVRALFSMVFRANAYRPHMIDCKKPAGVYRDLE